MPERIEDLKQEWEERGKRLGATKRAVLFKRFPGWLNQSIHRRHVRFIIESCPTRVAKVLDVGCGYGRIAREVSASIPAASFQGVDLCTEFALEYERTVGPCFNGPIQSFSTDERFDLILIVTTLMYLTRDEHEIVLERLWSMLGPQGRIVCIEPASEMFMLWRRLTGKESASPTGGTVQHFLQRELEDSFAGLDRARIVARRSVTLVPLIGATTVHHGIAVEKS
jgi:ubiquinone/menaquinone biosynthesis C-methylase UbiE